MTRDCEHCQHELTLVRTDNLPLRDPTNGIAYGRVHAEHYRCPHCRRGGTLAKNRHDKIIAKHGPSIDPRASIIQPVATDGGGTQDVE